MDINTVAWAGVASLLIHMIQGGFVLAKHFRLHSECCGSKSSVAWDVGTPPEDKSSSSDAGGEIMKKVTFSLPLPGGRPGGE